MQPQPSLHSRFLALPSGRVHYREGGSGPPLILLHANPGDNRDFDAIWPALTARFHVLALDWPGYGQSDMPAAPGSRAASFFGDVLRAFIEALALPPAYLLGNSLGGNAAASLAVRAPHLVAGLVLVSPGGFTAHNVVTRGFCRLQGSRFALPPKWWAAMYLRRRTPLTRAMLARAAQEQATVERLALNRAVWRSFAQPAHDLRPLAGGIQVPVLLVFGRFDPAIPAAKDGRQARACLPHARFVALPCGHAPFAEMPEQFLAALQPFLADCLAGLAAEPSSPAGPPALSRLKCTGVTPT